MTQGGLLTPLTFVATDTYLYCFQYQGDPPCHGAGGESGHYANGVGSSVVYAEVYRPNNGYAVSDGLVVTDPGSALGYNKVSWSVTCDLTSAGPVCSRASINVLLWDGTTYDQAL